MSNRKHSIRMLGIAFVAVFAMSAVAASAASAAKFKHEAGAGVTARVIATNEGAHEFTAGVVGTISCKKATFTGTEFLLSGQATVTVSPAYSECTFLGVSNVAVNVNGCTYRFNEPTGLTSPFTGTVNVLCPVGKKIEFEASGCKVEVGEQGPLSSLTFTNGGTSPNRFVTVTANVTKIAYTASGKCAVLGEKTDGTYKGTAKAQAETEGEKVVGAFIE
jgi:hypothetical protein